MAAPSTTAAVTVEYVLPPQHSLWLRRRFAPDACLSVKLLASADSAAALPSSSGPTAAAAALETAEMLGCDVKPNVPHPLPPGASVSLYTHTGCTVAVAGDPLTLQLVCVVPGSAAVCGASELHYALEQRRVAAKRAMDVGDEAAVGPRVLVVSARSGCGASTLVQLLANYAVRLRYHPLVVDLDVDCPSLGSLPKSIAVHALQHPVDVTEGYSLSPCGLHLHYGSEEIGWNSPLMAQLLRTASEACLSRQSRFPRSRVGGIFIDYPTLDAQAVLEALEQQQQRAAEAGGGSGGLANVKANPIDALLAAIAAFDVDTVVVVGCDWLRHELHRTCAERFGGASDGGGSIDGIHTLPLPRNATARLVSFPASELAVPRAPALKDALRREHWRTYLFGTATSPVTPAFLQLDLAKVRLVRTRANEAEAMQGLLPMQDPAAALESAAMDPYGFMPARVDPMQHLQVLTVHDVKLPGMVVGISDAPSMRAAAGASAGGGAGEALQQPLSYDEYFHAVGRCTLAGYALVHAVTATAVTLVVPNGGLPLQRHGLTCLVLTDTFLAHRERSAV